MIYDVDISYLNAMSGIVSMYLIASCIPIISLFDFVVKGYQRLNIEVYDVATGSKVATQQNITAGTKIQLGQLARGTYIVRVTSNDNKIAQQFKMVKL